ncbi:FAH family protein [Aphelenchoides besseyi]|nr:FAH family protein [Aphelenchoides besseyi]
MIRAKPLIDSTTSAFGSMANFTKLARRIICVGRNYPDPSIDHRVPLPQKPILFMKSSGTFIDENQLIPRPPGCQRLNTEVELGVVLGHTAKNVKREDAYDYIAGYALALDMTAGDLLEELRAAGLPWMLAKSFDGSCPVSTFIDKEFVPDPHQLELTCRVNGVIRQRERTNRMIFDIPTLVEYITNYMTLEPGDVILTGTPANVQVIDAYFKLIVQRAESDSNGLKIFAFSTYFYPKLKIHGHGSVSRWTSNVNIFQYDLLFFPINDEFHWTLVVIHLRKNQIFYYDSVKFEVERQAIVAGRRYITPILQYLKEESLEKRKIPWERRTNRAQTLVLEDFRKLLNNSHSHNRQSALADIRNKLDVDFYGWKNGESEWNPLHWLRLTDVVCQFYENFQQTADGHNRYDYFTFLFCGYKNEDPRHEMRMNFLCQVCSFALQFGIYTIFDDVATWFMEINCVYPLRSRAIEFSCYFLVYSINEKNLRPQLIDVLGQWLNNELMEILRILAENSTLSTHFGEQCIPLLVHYDVKRSANDEIHNRLHCAVLSLLLQWRAAFPNSLEMKNVTTLPLDLLVDLIANSDQLKDFQQERLVQCVKNAYLRSHFPISLFRQRFHEFDNCSVIRNGHLAELITD